jgi:NitT/TauT family transport system permease protein
MRLSPTLLGRAAPWISVVTLILAWWLGVAAFDVKSYILPTPAETLRSLVEHWRPLATNGAITLATTLLGFSVTLVFGTLLGMLVGTSRLAHQAIYPLIVAFNSVPKAALVPIFIVWFGLGTVPAVITAFLLSFFPVVANVALAFSSIEPELVDLIRSLGGSRRDLMVKIGIPRSLPYLFASLKVAITLSFVGSIIAEVIGGNGGIGNVMLVASSNFDMPLVFAALSVVGVLGTAMYAVFELLDRRWASWAVRPAGLQGTANAG